MRKMGTVSGKPLKATIHDVAKEAHVALSTVSNALTGKQYVSDETRTRVQAAAIKLGYRASGVARALRLQRTFTIGVLMADVANPSSPDFLRGIEDVADREQCSLLVCNTDGLLSKQIDQMRVLLDRQVDGLVLISQYCDTPLIRVMLDAGTPFVLLQRRSIANKDDYVGADNVEGITAAVQHLVDFGHKRIGFVRGPKESSTADERFEAYRAAVNKFDLDDDNTLIFQGNYNFQAGVDAAKYFFGLTPRPTAILAANDMSAMGVMDVAHRARVAIPKSLSLIGLDDIQLASFSPINLTTINLPKREMGAAAAKLLMERIRRKRTVTAKQVSFPMKLVVRGSTGPAKA